MDYRMFYTWHGICGILLFLQLIFIKTWLPLHLLALIVSILIVWRFYRNCFFHIEIYLGVLVLYLYRLALLYWFKTIMLFWWIYGGGLFILGIIFIFIGLSLFFL